MKLSKGFNGIWIPIEILICPELNSNEKIILAIIYGLRGKKGCWANNKYFSNILGIQKKSVSAIISKLISRKYIESRVLPSENNRRLLNLSSRLMIRIPEKWDNVSLENRMGYPRKEGGDNNNYNKMNNRRVKIPDSDYN